MQGYTMTEAALTTFANQVKEVLVANLVEAKVISKEQSEYIAGNYAIVCSEKGTLGKMFDKLRRKDGNEAILITVLKGTK
jgi:hypothetical protein